VRWGKIDVAHLSGQREVAFGWERFPGLISRRRCSERMGGEWVNVGGKTGLWGKHSSDKGGKRRGERSQGVGRKKRLIKLRGARVRSKS